MAQQALALYLAECDLQAGQLPGVGVDSVALAVKSFQGWAKSRNLKWGLLFFDVKAAFYKVVREALVCRNPEDGRVLRLLRDLGIPEEALPELAAKLESAAQLSEAGVGEHLRSQVADLLQGTWFRLDGCATLILTARGSRPGDPLADILFAFTFSAYLRAAENALRQQGLHTPLPPAGQQSPWNEWDMPSDMGCAAWADDYAQAQAASSTAVLCNQVVRAATTLAEHATAAGMQLTYAADKTAVMLSADNVLTAAHGIEWNAQGQPGFSVRNAILGSAHFLPIVASYKHLGGILTANGTPAADTQFRYAQAQSILRPLYSRLFSSQAVPLQIRRTMLRALVISRYVWSGSASLLATAMHRRQWCQQYVLLWRGLCRWPRGAPSPHSYSVLQLAGAPNPLLALAQMRAVLLRRIVKHGPATLLHLLDMHWKAAPRGSWLGLFLEDIEAVAMYAEPASVLLAMPDPVGHLLCKVQEDPQWWPGQVRAAIRKFGRKLADWSPQLGHPEHPEPEPEAMPFTCKVCNAAFRLRKHLAVHQARSHGLLSPARHYAPGRVCLSCLKLFHNVERCQYHLKQTKACLLRLVHVMPPLDLAAIRLAETEDVQRRKALKRGRWQEFSATVPAQQTLGPRPPTYSELLRDLSDEDIHLSLLQRAFRPSAQVLDWIWDYVESKSTEGPRQTATSIWLLPIPSGASA